jgi:general secretion pathway protein L
MNLTELRTTLEQGFSRWIDSIAEFIATLLNRFAAPRLLKLVEREADEFDFHIPGQQPDPASAAPHVRIIAGQVLGRLPQSMATMLRGSRVEITLKPDRFLFCPLELPSRATEFLDGIIRSQIDRLTPWTAANAAFGWNRPHQAGGDRIAVTIAATDRALVAPYVQAIAGLGAQSIAVYTAPAADDCIKVMEERTAGFGEVGKIRQILIATLLIAGIITTIAVSASRVIAIKLDAQQAELDFRIAKFRAAAGRPSSGSSASFAAAELTLEKHKQTTPPDVIILETLSRILPDHTFVTELRIEDNKVQLEGATRDAPSLIKLIEQSGLFSRAAFFAPTTRSRAETVERFHIEAAIQAKGTPRL